MVNASGYDLKTPFEKEDGILQWEEYPRPQMRREQYQMLNGDWDLVKVHADGARTPQGKIRVPYPPESRISGIRGTLRKGQRWSYTRSFYHELEKEGGHVLLHVGAADQVAVVYVNEKRIGKHEGGYLPFTFDITEAMREGENFLRIDVKDDGDVSYPWGKQRQVRGGMWYTPFSGIWQSVWLEEVPWEYIRRIKITPDLRKVRIQTKGGVKEKSITLHLEEGDRTYFYSGDEVSIRPPHPHLWSPEDPYLYHFTLACGEDRIESYFALRTVSIEETGRGSRIFLNGRPRFLHGILDQGYYSDGICLPSSPEGYRSDVAKMKALGFNLLRKHIKIEPEVYYYECDRQGMLVLQDLVNSGRYYKIVNTVLPTIGMKLPGGGYATEHRKKQFARDAKRTLDLLYNHPCVIGYTIFNEGWGEFEPAKFYKAMKAYDTTRFYDTASGWFEKKSSDVASIHEYFHKFVMPRIPKKPTILSEFGGYSYKVPGHTFRKFGMYGYKKFHSLEQFREAIRQLYLTQVLPAAAKGLSGAVLTQLSDVEDETNGMVTYDRQVCKVDETAMRSIARQLYEAADGEEVFKEEDHEKDIVEGRGREDY